MCSYFEFHDSVLAAVVDDVARCIVELRPAYVHRSAGIPGVDAGEGFWQDLAITIECAKMKMPQLELPTDIGDGYLSVGDIRMANLAPTQLREEKKVLLKIVTMVDGTEIDIEGTSIEIRTIGEAVFAESFPGTPK